MSIHHIIFVHYDNLANNFFLKRIFFVVIYLSALLANVGVRYKKQPTCQNRKFCRRIGTKFVAYVKSVFYVIECISKLKETVENMEGKVRNCVFIL